MAVYMTRQRKMLLDFLSMHPHDIFSAVQIAEHIENGEISLSAIYRNLSELESAGHIRKVVKVRTREVFYQYSNASSCKNKIHLHCKVCDRFFHLDNDTADDFCKATLEGLGFEINKSETIITGVCDLCRKK